MSLRKNLRKLWKIFYILVDFYTYLSTHNNGVERGVERGVEKQLNKDHDHEVRDIDDHYKHYTSTLNSWNNKRRSSEAASQSQSTIKPSSNRQPTPNAEKTEPNRTEKSSVLVKIRKTIDLSRSQSVKRDPTLSVANF